MAKDIKKTLQALLFATDKPLSVSVIAQVLEIPHKEVIESIEGLNADLKSRESPITIKQIAGGYEFLTLPEYSPYIKKLYKNRFMTRLSKPAMEVVAIIAYKQPISKQEVEAIRGVASDGVYHTLLERNLIKITGRKDAPGRPLLYGTTKDFLQYLGINTIDDLPKIEEIQTILEQEEQLDSWEERIEVAKNQSMLAFGEDDKKRLKEKSRAATDEDIENVIEQDEEEPPVTEDEEVKQRHEFNEDDDSDDDSDDDDSDDDDSDDDD
ncbi:MAG: SMC-Scp complex subunit ScpB, partial [Candidatus Goldiibacteriota bacterium]